MISEIYKILSTPIRKFLFWRVGNINISQPASAKGSGVAKKTIHIVRLDAIGDFVLFSAVLPYFRKIYPQYKIVLIIDEVVKELAIWLNENQIMGMGNYFDDIIAIDGRDYNRNFFYYYAMLKKIRMSAPEIVIQPTFSRTEKSDDMVFISKEAQKIAYQGDLSNIKLAIRERNDKKYDRLIKNPSSLLEVERNKYFINQLAEREILSSGIPRWQITDNLINGTKNKLELLGINFTNPLIVICPGSSRKIKNWPPENFTALILKLSEAIPDLQFILIGGSNEKKVCDQVQKNTNSKSLYNICGQFTLPNLAQVLSNAKLYIGNDTGAMHMACAVGINVIGIMSGEQGVRFFPYLSSDQKVKNIAVFSKAHKIGIENIKMEDVMIEAMKVLKS